MYVAARGYAHFIKIRIIHVPKMRRRNGKRNFRFSPGIGRRGNRRSAFCRYIFFRVQNFKTDAVFKCRARFIPDFGRYGYVSVRSGFDNGFFRLHIDIGRNVQINISVNARAFVPPALGLIAVHANGDGVHFAVQNMIGQLQRKRGVSA